MSFLEALVQQAIIKREEIPVILKRTEESSESLDSVLLQYGIREEVLMKAKGDYFHMPVRSLEADDISLEVLRYIPEDSARHYHFVPIGIKDSVVEIGITQPDDLEAMDALQFISTRIKMPFRVFLISLGDFERVLTKYKDLEEKPMEASSDVEREEGKMVGSPEKASFPEYARDPEQSFEQQNQDRADVERELNESLGNEPEEKTEGVKAKMVNGDLQKELAEVTKEISSEPTQEEKEDKTADIVEETPASKIVAVVLRHAVEGGASDIHIEPTGDRVRVRFRIDGELHTSIVLPMKVHAAMVSRIKILTNLKLDQKRKPQDGRFSVNIEGRKVDLRVSTYPAYYGEKVVIRLLDSSKGMKSIPELGLREVDYEKVKRAIKKPYGMILLTGPTGSGKSTTLYSMLNELDREKANIVSLEDPIEYHIDGVSQSNVRPEIGYTFATGLRSILRQDPDVIMVGEIRDKETAELAVQAALTGHLVFSTLHTNSAVGVIPRLLDMGVDPYLIAPTLIMVIGQRLAAALCEGTGKKVPVDESMQMMIDKEFADLPEEHRAKLNISDSVYEAEPTASCPSGIRGRQAVFEVFEINNETRHVILKNPVENEVFEVARKNGMLTMKEDALLKAFDGLIPYVEVNKL